MFDFETPQNAIAELRQARSDFLVAQASFEGVKQRLSSALGDIGKGADEDLLEDFVAALIRSAEQTFSPAGCAAEIDRLELEDVLVERTGWEAEGDMGHGRRRPLLPRLSTALLAGDLSVEDCWGAMKQILSSDEAIDSGYAAVAGPLARRFGSSFLEKVRRVGGQIAIGHQIWVDDMLGNCTLHYNGVRDFEETIGHLAAVAEWAEMDELALELRRRQRSTIGYHTKIVSRQKIPLGGGITLVTFKSRFEYRLPEAFGIALGQFIRQYAGEQLERMRC